MRTVPELLRACDESLAALDKSLAEVAQPLSYFDADLNEMTMRPAATVAGSVNLLDAVNARRSPTPFVLSLIQAAIDADARAAVEGRDIEQVA